jgi:hypothetical protein
MSSQSDSLLNDRGPATKGDVADDHGTGSQGISTNRDVVVVIGAGLSNNVVVATGLFRSPVLPDWPGCSQFRGRLMHSGDYRNASELTRLRCAGGGRRLIGHGDRL